MAEDKKSQKITIDDVEYNLDDLSDKAKAQIPNIQFVESQLQQLNNEWAVSDTARIAYTNALKAELAKVGTSEQKNMSQKIKLGDEEYEVDNLGDQAKETLNALKFATARVQELTNMLALLQRAKNSYSDSLKKEVISTKGGLIFGED